MADIDYTGIPESACPECGDNKFSTWITIDPDDYEIQMYGTDGLCMECGTLYTIATPPDHPDEIEMQIDTEIEEEEEDNYED